MSTKGSTMTPQEFVAKWRPSTLKERSGSQEHFIDLCRMLGHETPAQADSEGKWFTFDRGADKSTGGQGWADVWKKGFFAWEYKGKNKDLDAAHAQLLRYCDALLNPPLLVVSDMETIVVHTNFNNTVRRDSVRGSAGCGRWELQSRSVCDARWWAHALPSAGDSR
jgi:hypothetical protein